MTRILFAIAELELTSVGAVLTPDLFSTEGEPDTSPAHDGRGRHIIPGATIAGSLRAHAADSGIDTDALFGFVAGEDAVASVITVCGASLRLPDGETTAIEHATAIDRERNASRNRALRTREYLPKGTSLTIYLRANGVAGPQIDEIVRLVASWRPALGAATSTGHGATQMLSLRTGTLDLSVAADLRTYLTTHGAALFDTVATSVAELAGEIGSPTVTLDFEVVGSISVGSGESTRRESHDVATVLRRGGAPVVPGSTWKGLVRSRSEFVLRSLLPAGQRPCLDARCGECVTCLVFGSGGDEMSARSSVAFSDSEIADGRLIERSHNAIDRFTGGVADGLLFTKETIEGGTVTLTVTALDPRRWDLAKALVILVAHDMDRGYVGVGGSTTRGYGQLRLTGDPEIHAAHLAEARATLKTFVDKGAA